MDETNPYRPPEADLGIARDPGRHRPLFSVFRVLIGLWGLFTLAGASGAIAGKALGALLFMAAVFPLRKPKSKSHESRESLVEDL